jgi:hypothetical protein
MIINEELTLKKADFPAVGEIPRILEEKYGDRILRWYISAVDEEEVCVEMTLLREAYDCSPPGPVSGVYPGKSVSLSIIPTGIGCDIGGYAADAAPASALMASCCDYMITNPNAVNASNFISMPDNLLYAEGFIIDQFCKGLVNLYIPYGNTVGLIVDTPGRDELDTVYNIINTVRAVYGVKIETCAVTSQSIGGKCVRHRSGSYVGGLENPGALFDACERLLEKGVNAIAVTSNIKDLPMDNYAEHFGGKHPNPIGGAEAVISHSICKKYGIPAAHAPLSNVKDLALESRIVDARGAGEFLSVSGLACVLIGLNKAPQVSRDRCRGIKDIVNIDNLMTVVAPSGALGGVPVLCAETRGIPILAVKENKTILDVTREKLNLEHVVPVNNYPEAAGIVQALGNGINISSLYRPLETLRI